MSETFPAVEEAYASRSAYQMLDALLQSSELDEGFLQDYVRGTRGSTDATTLLSGAWARLELSELLTAQGEWSPAQFFFTSALSQAEACESALLTGAFAESPNNLTFLYRARMLTLYASYFQFGKSWARTGTPPKRHAETRRDVHNHLVKPLLEDLEVIAPGGTLTTPEQTRAVHALNKIKSELYVMQLLSRQSEVIALPASPRQRYGSPDDPQRRFNLVVHRLGQSPQPVWIWFDSANGFGPRTRRDPRIAILQLTDPPRTQTDHFMIMQRELERPNNRAFRTILDSKTAALMQQLDQQRPPNVYAR